RFPLAADRFTLPETTQDQRARELLQRLHIRLRLQLGEKRKVEELRQRGRDVGVAWLQLSRRIQLDMGHESSLWRTGYIRFTSSSRRRWSGCPGPLISSQDHGRHDRPRSRFEL